jgi:hypothetical protein
MSHPEKYNPSGEQRNKEKSYGFVPSKETAFHMGNDMTTGHKASATCALQSREIISPGVLFL